MNSLQIDILFNLKNMCFHNLFCLQDVLEVQLDVLKEGTRVLIIDDLLATGGM